MKKIILVLCLSILSVLSGIAQNEQQTSKKKIVIDVKENSEQSPVILIDGKQYDSDILDLIDPAKIDNINVIKDKDSLDKYNAPNGIIKITTKKALSEKESDGELKRIKIRENYSNAEPLIIVDGKICPNDTLKNMAPGDINAIDVLKNESALEKYEGLKELMALGKYKVENGVIIVTTKKAHEKKIKEFFNPKK